MKSTMINDTSNSRGDLLRHLGGEGFSTEGTLRVILCGLREPENTISG